MGTGMFQFPEGINHLFVINAEPISENVQGAYINIFCWWMCTDFQTGNKL